MSIVYPFLNVPVSVDGYTYIVDTQTLPTMDCEINFGFQVPKILDAHQLTSFQGTLQRANYVQKPPECDQKASGYMRVALSISLIVAALLCPLASLPPSLAIVGAITSIGLYALLALYNQRKAGSESPLNLLTLIKGPYYPLIELEKGNNTTRDRVVSQFNTAFNDASTFFKNKGADSLKAYAERHRKEAIIAGCQSAIAIIDEKCRQQKPINLKDVTGQDLSELAALREEYLQELINLGGSIEETKRDLIQPPSGPYSEMNKSEKKEAMIGAIAFIDFRLNGYKKGSLSPKLSWMSLESCRSLSELQKVRQECIEELSQLGSSYQEHFDLDIDSQLRRSRANVSSWDHFIDVVDKVAHFYLEGYKANPY